MAGSGSLGEFIDQLPIISTHEHHREDEFQQGLDLHKVFTNSYVGWGPWPQGTSTEARAQWLAEVRHRAYFVWLQKAIGRVYGVERITAENWDDISASISKAHRDASHHVRVLREVAQYKRFVQDAYWNPGSDAGHPEIATPVYRIDMWLAGFHPDAVDHDNVSVHRMTGLRMRTLGEYEEALRDQIRKRRTGIAALKCAAAYERSIAFGAAGRAEAEAVFGCVPSKVSVAQRKLFGDYIMGVVLEMAAELELPVQVHTGMALLGGSEPLLLAPTIAAHPKVRFVLFHGGYPWVHQIGAMAHSYGNVCIDLCWLPLLSTTVAEAALHEYIEVSPAIGRIAWGADCWTSEESLGASLALRYVLKRVLERKVEEGYLTVADAEAIAEKIAWRNAAALYGVG